MKFITCVLILYCVASVYFGNFAAALAWACATGFQLSTYIGKEANKQ